MTLNQLEKICAHITTKTGKKATCEKAVTTSSCYIKVYVDGFDYETLRISNHSKAFNKNFVGKSVNKYSELSYDEYDMCIQVPNMNVSVDLLMPFVDQFIEDYIVEWI